VKRFIITPVLVTACLISAARPGDGQTGTPPDKQVSPYPVAVTVAPDPVRIVDAGGTLQLDFDFHIANSTPDSLEIALLRVSAYDSAGIFLTRKELNRLGLIPCTRELCNTEVGPGARIIVFNPFYSWRLESRPAELRYTFGLVSKNSESRFQIETTVRPAAADPRTVLHLPLEGKLFVWDGFGIQSHHRRFDPFHEFSEKLGIKSNPSRYGLDFEMVDETGRTYHDDPARLENYYIYGRLVLATAAGSVADCVDGRPDSEIGRFSVDYDEIFRTRDLRLFGGNFIYLDHGNGEFSTFLHLRPGSLKVRIGDRVEADQVIAEVGNSGDSIEPHLHYQLNLQPRFDSESLPPVFHDFRRWHGERSRYIAAGIVDTGDIVERADGAAR
jgi:hypothetical protein